jgi:hypothetical protein
MWGAYTTIEDPYNYTHPVAGNRQFGFEANGDGTYTFYTRGADRIHNLVVAVARDAGKFATEMDMLNQANPVWASFQTLVESYVTGPAIGGSATVIPPTPHRPNYDLLSRFLSGDINVDQLEDCN